MQNEIVIKKPRKPRTKKADMIKKKEEAAKLKALQPPKKRGRKPKGGIIMQKKINLYDDVLTNEIIILHLKCRLYDIDNTKDITSYNPVLENVIPYENINNNYYNIDISNTTIKNTVNKDIINKSNELQENIKEKKILLNDKKNINIKLKELENNLNLNDNKKKSACFWCSYDFNSNPIYIPTTYYQKKYDVYGCFCSPECATSYLFNQEIDNNCKFESYQLLNYIYGKIYNYKKNIKPAPNPYYLLDKYYGNLNIQEYRQLLEYDRLILIIDKPLTKIYPELHEDNNNFETIYENKISLKKQLKTNKLSSMKKVFNN